MTGPLAAPSRTTDWLAVATACLFAVNGAALIFQNETVLFRLAVLGWPAWTAVLLALVHFVFAALLLPAGSRFHAALGLVVVAAVTLGAHVAYREPRAAGLAAGQLVVVLILLLAPRRRRRSDA